MLLTFLISYANGSSKRNKSDAVFFCQRKSPGTRIVGFTGVEPVLPLTGIEKRLGPVAFDGHFQDADDDLSGFIIEFVEFL